MMRRREALLGMLSLACIPACEWSLVFVQESTKKESITREEETMNFGAIISMVVFESAWARRASWPRGISIHVVWPGTDPTGLTQPCVAVSKPTAVPGERERTAWQPTQEDMFASDWEIIPT